MKNKISELITAELVRLNNGPAPIVPGLTPLRFRACCLVVCRESNEHDKVLLEGLVSQTLAYCTHLSSISVARQLGILPLTAPGEVPPDVTVVHLKEGGARAVLFEINGDYYLYSMASAAKCNLKGDNDFTLLLGSVLAALQPVDVYVASLSRLVRTFSHSTQVLLDISRYVDCVHAGDTPIQMRGPGSATGQLLWAVLSMIAASERDLIVQRLTSGVVAKYRRGEWIKGPNAVPLGYVYDAATKNLRVDPEQTEHLRFAFTLLATPDIPAWKVVQELAARGVTTHTAKKRHGEDATVADLRSPQTYVEQLLRWVPLYLTGTHVTEWTNPFVGADHIAGLTVVGGSPSVAGDLHFTYDWGRPDIDPSLIQLAVEVRGRKSGPTGAAAKAQTAPLNGVTWSDGEHEYKLRGLTESTYEIRMRTNEDAA